MTKTNASTGVTVSFSPANERWTVTFKRGCMEWVGSATELMAELEKAAGVAPLPGVEVAIPKNFVQRVKKALAPKAAKSKP